MATKTLTITEDAYDLLAEHKLENESFSQEIRRIMAKRQRKSLLDFFGILSKEKGHELLRDLQEIREFNLRSLKEKIR